MKSHQADTGCSRAETTMLLKAIRLQTPIFLISCSTLYLASKWAKMTVENINVILFLYFHPYSACKNHSLT